MEERNKQMDVLLCMGILLVGDSALAEKKSDSAPARFENPDGSALALKEDLAGKTRSGQPKAGPLEDIREGKNRIRIWTGRASRR